MSDSPSPDTTSDRTAERSFRNIASVVLLSVVVIAFAGLLGYLPGFRLLGSIGAEYVPMAPATALCFLILSAALFILRQVSPGPRQLAVSAALVIIATLFCMLELAEVLVGADLNASLALFPLKGTIGVIPVGQMSPVTAATFSIAGIGSLLALFASRRGPGPVPRRPGDAAAALGAVTALIGATIILAYLYGKPLMYGGSTIPMAATTALAFLLLGLVLVVCAGPGNFLMRRVSGNSTADLLSRAFIPLIFITFLAQSMISRYQVTSPEFNGALVMAAMVLALGLGTVSVVDYVSRRIGRGIDEVNGRLQQTLNELKEREEHRRDILHTAMDGIILADPGGRLKEVNEAYCLMSGFTAGELLDMNLADLAPGGADGSEAGFCIGDVVASGEGRFETRHRRKNGSVYDVEISVKYRPHQGGQLVIFLRDISERKLREVAHQQAVNLRQAEHELRKKEKLHRDLLDTIPDLIWLKDPEGVYLSCNSTFERFFGAKEAEIVGRTDYDFVERELADFFRDHDRKAMEAGGPSSNEEWITFADNGQRALLYTTKMPMYDSQDNLIGILCGRLRESALKPAG